MEASAMLPGRRCLYGLLAALTFLGPGCGERSDGFTTEDRVHQSDALLRDLEVAIDSPAEITSSKSVRYITAQGARPGDPQVVIDHLTAALTRHGWRLLPVRETSAVRGVRAVKDGAVAALAVYEKVGVRPAPSGACWVQLALAEPTDALDWTQP
jgi:hypothetical protein